MESNRIRHLVFYSGLSTVTFKHIFSLSLHSSPLSPLSLSKIFTWCLFQIAINSHSLYSKTKQNKTKHLTLATTKATVTTKIKFSMYYGLMCISTEKRELIWTGATYLQFKYM